ncbi:MAG: CoA ester lyase [Chloroflexi bacterium]|nr:CoA ester lyase [Chloroflexota bacterium]
MSNGSPIRARRALLYVPGSDARKIEKLPTLSVDSACLDLEDGVALNRKVEAREIASRALQSMQFNCERLARINAVGSGLEADDLAAIVPAKPDGIVIPKVADGAQVQWVSAQIANLERAQGWKSGEIGLIAMIESARGIVNLREIASADARLRALIFGAEDYAADVGAIRTRDGDEVLFARSAVATYAAAFGLQAIDLLYLDFGDIEGLRREARRGAELGFSGMQIIHPDQIAPVQEAFTPDASAIVQAKRIVEAFKAHQSEGKGAFALDGKMVDMPIVKAAERVLARASIKV